MRGYGHMDPAHLLMLCVVAGACGTLGHTLAGTQRGGYLAAIALGFIGALLGSWLAQRLDWPAVLAVDIGTTEFPLLWSALGAASFVALLGWVSRPPAPRHE